MPRARDAKIWNQDLAAACDARLRIAQANSSRSEFAWRKARDDINAMSQEIYVTKSSGNIIHLDKAVDPTKQKAIYQELVKVIEGKAQIGDGNAAGVGTPAGRGAHQYLDQMQNRGGGYAILCAFHFHAAPGETLMIDEICRLAQPYCNEEMRPTYFNPGARGLRGGWNCNKQLQNYGILVKVGGGATRLANGSYRATKDVFMLNDAVARPFIRDMLEKWPAQRVGGGGGGGGSPFGGAHFGGGGGGGGGGGLQWSKGGFRSAGGGGAKPNKHNAHDRAELETWLRDPTTPLGGIKEFNVSKDRR